MGYISIACRGTETRAGTANQSKGKYHMEIIRNSKVPEVRENAGDQIAFGFS